MSPFDGNHEKLQAVGKFILIEVIKEKTEEKKTQAGIILPASRIDSSPEYGYVLSIGDKVTSNISPGDYIEAVTQMYANIVDSNGISRYQMIHEDQIAGVYKKKN